MFFGFPQIDEHVQREIMNHRSLKHPNIIRFKEVNIPLSRTCISSVSFCSVFQSSYRCKLLIYA